MFNSSKRAVDLGDSAMVAQLRQHGVRDDTLQAARLFQAALAPFGASSGLAGERQKAAKEPALYVNSPVDGYCGVCGVDGVGGPGAASCDYSESCDGFAAPPGFEGLTE